MGQPDVHWSAIKKNGRNSGKFNELRFDMYYFLSKVIEKKYWLISYG